jgi:acyl-coenzyme A synthetase/AMP-(fatty) acid ligase
MIIVGGFNVYPAEVENALLAHESIGQVAIIGIPDRRMGEVPAATSWPLRAIDRSRRDHPLGARAARQLQGAAARDRARSASVQRRRQGV